MKNGPLRQTWVEGCLKTHFGAYLILKDGFLLHERIDKWEDALCCLLTEKGIAFSLSNVLYVNGIDKDGRVTLGATPIFFGLENKDGKWRIKSGDKYLSAREDGKIWLVRHARNWEAFELVNMSAPDYSSTHNEIDYCLMHELVGKLGNSSHPISDQNQEKSVAVMLITDKRRLVACGTMIMNLLDKIENLQEIDVYHGNLSLNDVATLEGIDPRCKVISYNNASFLMEYEFITPEIFSQRFFEKYTYLTVIKFKIFNMLRRFDKAILMDTDMLLLNSLKSILADDVTNIFWSNDYKTLYEKLAVQGYAKIEDVDLQEYKDISTPNGGFIVLNKNFDYEKAYSLSIEFLKTACEKHPVSIDETLFGYVASKLGLSVVDLDREKYNVPPARFNHAAELIHFIGNFKIWNSPILQGFFPQWAYYYNRYLQASGSEAVDPVLSPQGDSHVYAYLRAEKWRHVISSIVLPQTLICDFNFLGDILRLYHTSTIYIECRIGYYLSKLHLRLHIDPCIADFSSGTQGGRRSALGPKDTLAPKSGETIKTDLSLDSTFPVKFADFMKECGQAIETFEQSYSYGNGAKGTLKTCFGSVLTLENDFLHHERGPGRHAVAHAILVKSALALQNQDGFYLRYVSDRGQVALSRTPSFFEVEREGDHIRIKTQEQYLSARRDQRGEVHLVPRKQEWEHFEFITGGNG